MSTFSVLKDIDTSSHSGVDGFQIITIKDNDDKEIANLFDVGKFYRDDEQLIKDISKKLNIPLDQIDLNEE